MCPLALRRPLITLLPPKGRKKVLSVPLMQPSAVCLALRSCSLKCHLIVLLSVCAGEILNSICTKLKVLYYFETLFFGGIGLPCFLWSVRILCSLWVSNMLILLHFPTQCHEACILQLAGLFVLSSVVVFRGQLGERIP